MEILETIVIQMEPLAANRDMGFNFSTCWKPVLLLIIN